MGAAAGELCPSVFSLLKTCFQSHGSQNPVFIPFSVRQQQQKLMESRLICILDACSDLKQIKQVHGHMIRKGFEQCSFVLTKLIRVLTEFNAPMDRYTRVLFEQVDCPTPFLWTALIRGYALKGPLSESIVMYNCMRRAGTSPLSFTLSAVLKACGAMADVDLGKQIHGQKMKIGGFESDLHVGNTLIDMYLRCGALDCGHKVFDEMPQRDVISATLLIVAYSKNGDMGSARELFDRLPVKDVVAWTAIITGYAQNARPGECLDVFMRMLESGGGINNVALLGAISACAQLGTTQYATWVRYITQQSGILPEKDVVLGSAFIDMYSKCGMLVDAYKIFQSMISRNVYSYSSMILGFAIHGEANKALELFQEMGNKTDIIPNRVTFIGVLTACSHAGLVEEGRLFFSSMKNDYGVEPTADHYTCMVDLLGRAGCLEEALELAETMAVKVKVKPHGGVWGALLGACRIHRNPDIAEIAAGHLFTLEPDSIANYILLSNIHGSAGRWGDVSRVRKLMRTKGLRKNPGCSWIEGREGMIHEFFSGGDNINTRHHHPMWREMRETLEDLLERLKQVHGYTPNLESVPYDVCDAEKQRILMLHSEKLALAFGLLIADADAAAGHGHGHGHGSSSSIIRIMKNIRICEDCHLFMSGAAQITGRQIVIRDNMRFHHFFDGKCSCGNFW
ncbi:hypothetical protein Dimus_017319 [Dionaea muscipula]